MTLGARQTETRVARMAHALKNAMAVDPNARVICAALMAIMDDNAELAATFEELCGSVIVKVTMHEHQRWLKHDRKET